MDIVGEINALLNSTNLTDNQANVGQLQHEIDDLDEEYDALLGDLQILANMNGVFVTYAAQQEKCMQATESISLWEGRLAQALSMDAVDQELIDEAELELNAQKNILTIQENGLAQMSGEVTKCEELLDTIDIQKDKLNIQQGELSMALKNAQAIKNFTQTSMSFDVNGFAEKFRDIQEKVDEELAEARAYKEVAQHGAEIT